MASLGLFFVMWSSVAAQAQPSPQPQPLPRVPQEDPNGPTPLERMVKSGRLRAETVDQPYTHMHQIGKIRVNHRLYQDYALYIDGEYRGTIPVDAVLTVGTHRFEVLVGPGDRIAFDEEIRYHPNVQTLQLGSVPQAPASKN